MLFNYQKYFPIYQILFLKHVTDLSILIILRLLSINLLISGYVIFLHTQLTRIFIRLKCK